MTKASMITDWLQHPENFSDNDRMEALTLLKEYPYFIPARYVEAAEDQKRHPFSAPMINMMQLYMGNWLLFHQYLESCKVKAHKEEPVIANNLMSEFEEDELFKDDTLTDEENEFARFNTTDDDYVETEEIEDDTLPGDGKLIYDFEEAIIETYKEESTVNNKPQEAEVNFTTAAAETQPEVKAEAQLLKEDQPEQVEMASTEEEEQLIQPIFTEDYFLQQGIQVSEEIPEEIDHQPAEDKSLMVMMSFSDWLLHFKTKSQRQREEQQDQRALKTMWQKEKLAAALEEENDEIPEGVFEMAVNSITKEEDLASESLAEILIRQGKYDKAIDMYRKLSLRNPQKNAYFARKIEAIQKEK
jgi:hypothetical protein